jgi:hypothetical protein
MAWSAFLSAAASRRRLRSISNSAASFVTSEPKSARCRRRREKLPPNGSTSQIAARTVWSRDEADENYKHLFGRAEQWDRRAALLAHDDSYVPVRLAYLFSEQTGRALDRGDRGSAVHYALETYDQVRAALKHLGQDRLIPELPSRFEDAAGGELGQA